LPARVEKLMKVFLTTVDAASDSPLGERMARAFAVIYAGGILGVQAGVLPWPEDRVLWAVRRCFKAARAELRDDAMLEREGRSRLWRALNNKEARAPWPTRGKQPTPTPAAKRIGVFRRRRKTTAEYAIVPAVFESWLPDRHQRELVLASLQRDGRLRVDGKNRTCQPRVLGPADRDRYYVVQRRLKASTTATAAKTPSKKKGPGGPGR
jgi:hypothetical protein